MRQKSEVMSKMVSKVVADKENVEGLLNAPPSTFSTNDGLWSGCLFDSHCHLNLVHRSELITSIVLI